MTFHDEPVAWYELENNMSDISTATIRANWPYDTSAKRVIHNLCDEIDVLRAQVATLTAERDAERQHANKVRDRLLAERDALRIEQDERIQRLHDELIKAANEIISLCADLRKRDAKIQELKKKCADTYLLQGYRGANDLTSWKGE